MELEIKHNTAVEQVVYVKYIAHYSLNDHAISFIDVLSIQVFDIAI